MTWRPLRVATAAALAAALIGCSGGGADVAAPAPGELPEGDPGTAAPEVPEPSGTPEEDHGEEPARTSIPPEAVLDPATLAGVAGGSWQVQVAGPEQAGPCGPLPQTGAGAARTVRLADETGRVLTQTVLAFAHGEDAEAVAPLADSFAECGWTAEQAPPLGSASAQARSTTGTVLVLAAEGAVVVLTGTGGLAEDAAVWDAIADVALGSSCPAGPEGCH